MLLTDLLLDEKKSYSHSLFIVKLQAIKNNVSLLRDLSKANIAGVVKTDAYGLGAVPITLALLDIGVRDFFVSYFCEAFELRNRFHDDRLRIFVFDAIMNIDSVNELIKYNLIPCINSKEDLSFWIGLCLDNQNLFNYPVAIQIETGLNRLGIKEDEIDYLFGKYGADIEKLNVCLVFSQLSSSEDFESYSNEKQHCIFAKVKEKYFPKVMGSLANSSAHFWENTPAFDLTRAGYAVYGGNPFLDSSSCMENVLYIFAKVLKLSLVEKNESIGYNGGYVVYDTMKTATIAIGYADGLFRNYAFNGGFFFFNGKMLPIVGKISMDLTVVDITSLTEDELQVGDFVEVVGDNITIEDIAVMTKTNGYEVLNSLGRGKRFRRHYI